MGLNAADKYYYSFAKDLLPLAVEKQMGIIGMKVMARGRILSSWTPPPVEVQKKSWEGSGAIATTPGTLTKRENDVLHTFITHQHRDHRLRFG